MEVPITPEMVQLSSVPYSLDGAAAPLSHRLPAAQLDVHTQAPSELVTHWPFVEKGAAAPRSKARATRTDARGLPARPAIAPAAITTRKFEVEKNHPKLGNETTAAKGGKALRTALHRQLHVALPQVSALSHAKLRFKRFKLLSSLN